MTQRYYVRKQPSGYTIHDHHLQGQIIATCTYREQATLVCKALNAWEAQYDTKVALPPEILRGQTT